MSAVVERDADRAVDLHNLHLSRTADMVREALQAPSGLSVAAQRRSRRVASRDYAHMPRPSDPEKQLSLDRRGKR